MAENLIGKLKLYMLNLDTRIYLNSYQRNKMKIKEQLYTIYINKMKIKKQLYDIYIYIYIE